MKIYKNCLAAAVPEYEINRKEFNRLMQVKKTTDRYDKKGERKIKIESKDNINVATFCKHSPQRIKSEYLLGPFALTFLTTSAELDPELPDSYTYAATIVFEEGEAVRVYRDSLNDGYTDAKFCDDTVMLLAVKQKNDEKLYLKVEGEPTGYSSWKFESETEGENEHNKNVIESYIDKTVKEYGIDRDKVSIIIQLKNC